MPRGLRSIEISVDGAGITRFGGLVLFQQFCKSIGLRRFLQTYVRWPAYTDRKFHPADLFLTHLYAKVAGLGRVESLKTLKLNGLLPSRLACQSFLTATPCGHSCGASAGRTCGNCGSDTTG